ncbi:MAG: thiamine phosphate synthase [Sulfurospirillum sp.]|nr:thiamine phosphate synthase [Sulfurospirillum sp.]MBL0702587.1 thiamine phosphate synthase [Sulfurospirillum sp.]
MKLYALLDYETLIKKKWTIEKFILTCEVLHVKIIQYRDKQGERARKIENLKLIKSLCDIILLVNDEVELVEFCDGLHVGQEDLQQIATCKKDAIANIRQKIGRKILGVSTHNKEEILEANSLDINYIGLGAYRATNTKDDVTVLKENLSEMARFSLKPVGAIGGVRVDDNIKGVSFLVVGSNLYEY